MSPTLTAPDDDRPGYAERAALVTRRVGGAVGVDARVTWRMLIGLVVAIGSVSMAPAPFAQLGVIALLVVAIDVARTRRSLYSAGERQ